jgi:hypothetical protein
MPTEAELTTLRDDFAKAALTGLVSARTDGLGALATWAYNLADAMLAVRATLAPPVGVTPLSRPAEHRP